MTNFKNIYEGEYNILNLIKNDNNCSAHFNYEYKNEAINLSVITYNPKHNTFFLLHTLTSKTKLDCLIKMYDYIYQLKTSMKEKTKGFCHYSIDWYCPDQKKLVTSSFCGENIEQILLKFHYGKNDKLTIYNIKLNPIGTSD